MSSETPPTTSSEDQATPSITGDAAEAPETTGKPVNRTKKRIGFLIKLAFTVGMLAWVAKGLMARDGADTMGEHLANLKWGWLVLAVGAQLTAIGFSIARWQRMLVGQGIKAPWRFLAGSFMIGRFWGAFTPAGQGLSGWRLFDVGARTGKWARSTATIGVEIILGQLAFGAVVMFASIAGLSTFGAKGVLLVNLFFAAIITVGVTFLARPTLFRVIAKFLPGSLRERVHTLIEAVCAYHGKTNLLVQAFFLAVGTHVFNNLIYVCAAQALGVELSIGIVFFASSIQILSTLIPLSVNGIGLREKTAMALYTSPAVGLSPAIAVLIPLVGFCCEMFVSAFGGLIFLLRRGGYDANIVVEDADREESYYEETGADESEWAKPRRGAALGFGGGLLAGVMIGVSEGAVIVSGSAVPTGLRSLVYGAVAYAIVCAPLGAAAGVIMAHVGRLMRRKAVPEPKAYARYAAAIFAAFAFVIAAFRLRRDVFGEEFGWKSLSGLQLLGGTALAALVVFFVLATLIGFVASRDKAAPILKPGGSLGLVAILVALVFGVSTVVGEPAAASEPSESADPPAAAGNVLVIVVDTLRADHLPAWGYENGSTPNLDAFAQDAVRFENAFSNSSWTRPSFASILTGRLASSHRVMSKSSQLPDSVTTLAESLRDAGYYTGGFATNFNIGPGYGFAQGFHSYSFIEPEFVLGSDAQSSGLILMQVARRVREKLNAWRGVVAPGSDYQDAETVNARLGAWLDTAPSRQPWMLFASYMDPHDPYFSHPYSGSGYSRAVHQNPDASEAPALRELYDGEITYWDEHFGALMDDLRRRGVYDDMTIIVTSDHGEEFGEHGGFWHGDTLYDEQVHVPLFVKLPGGSRAGSTVSHWVQSIDIMPTLLERQGVDVPEGVQGGDLFEGTQVIFAEESHAQNILQSVRDGRGGIERKFITANAGNPRGVPEAQLFHVDDDPGEQQDLVENASHAEEVEHLRGVLSEQAEAARTGRVEGQEAEVTVEDQVRLCGLGYLDDETCRALCASGALVNPMCERLMAQPAP